MLLKSNMKRNVIAILLLIAILQPANALQIKRLNTDFGTVLRLRGDVRDGDSGRLKWILQNAPVVGLDIRSGGGSLEDGVEIARIVRDKGLVVYASRECDSVCALVFFAAKERYLARRSKIGVHSVSNQRGKEDADTARSTVMMSRLLAGLGVPHSIIGKIVATPPARIAFLNNHELAGLNVRRTNPFRNLEGVASSASSQEANSICDPGVGAERERAAHSRQKLCMTPVAHAGEP
jgi:hypothetical protein